MITQSVLSFGFSTHINTYIHVAAPERSQVQDMQQPEVSSPDGLKLGGEQLLQQISISWRRSWRLQYAARVPHPQAPPWHATCPAPQNRIVPSYGGMMLGSTAC